MGKDCFTWQWRREPINQSRNAVLSTLSPALVPLDMRIKYSIRQSLQNRIINPQEDKSFTLKALEMY